MSKLKLSWFLLLWVFLACGPETIFVRPFLDTPELHMRNGRIFLQQEKWEDARREFRRAAELDPYLTEAYAGLGVALAGCGDLDQGRQMLSKAEAMADSDDTRVAVNRGWEQFNEIRQKQTDIPQLPIKP